MALPFPRMIWQWDPDTEGSGILKSLAKPRPIVFAPGLSSISQAVGEPVLTTNRAIKFFFSEPCVILASMADDVHENLLLRLTPVFSGKPSRALLAQLKLA